MINDNYAPVKLVGNGTTVDFSFNWNVLSSDYIRVYLEEISTGTQTEQTLGSDFTLDFDETGGTVTFATAPTALYYVIIAREIALSQEKPYTTSKGFDGKTLEGSLDKVTGALQDVNELASRAVVLPLGSSLTELYLPAPEAGHAIIWNDDEDALVNSSDVFDDIVADATAQAVAAAASASAASGSATTASNWAIKTDASVSGGEFSAKAHAIGATGLTTGSAKDWATKAEDSEVVTGQYSALHWAAKSEGFADDASDSADAAAASLSAAGLPAPAVSDTYLKRNAGNTAYDAKTAANVLSDIMAGTTASATDIVLGKRTTNPNQPAFFAIRSATQTDVTGDGTAVTAIYGNQVSDVGDCYNPSTGVFTAPVAGLYMLSFCVCFSGLTSSHTGCSVKIVTSNRTHVLAGYNPYACQYNQGGDLFSDFNGSLLTYMDAGDTAYVSVAVGGGTKVVDVNLGTSSNFFFSGYLVA